MDESLIGLPGADAASESRPEPVVSSDMRAARPESVCGSRSLRRPSISSSPGSVASLYHQRINEKHHGVVWATRKRTCFAESAAPGSHRGTHHTPPPRLERGGFIRHCRAEHAAQPLLACIVIACERRQEPVRRARTAPQRPDGSGLPIDESHLGKRGIIRKCHILERERKKG